MTGSVSQSFIRCSFKYQRYVTMHGGIVAYRI